MKSFRFSLKYLSKARGNNITRVISLTLGLSVALLVFSYVGFMYSYNRCYPDSKHLYQVWALYEEMGYGSQLQAPLASAMAQDMPQIKSATRLFKWFQKEDFTIDDDIFSAKVLLVDTSFFDVFQVPQISGISPREIFASESNMMISQSCAKRMFPGEDPVGKMVLFRNTVPKTICGVYKDFPANSSLANSEVMVAAEAYQDQFRLDWGGGDTFEVFFRLKDGARVEDVEAQIPEFSKKHPGLDGFMTSFKMNLAIMPITKSLYAGGYMDKAVMLVGALGLLTLLVATLNYILISISGLVKRSRTIALLKCNGAHKNDVFKIFLSETAILLFVALLLSVILIYTAKGPIKNITSYSVNDLFSLKRIWLPALVLLGSFLLAGVVPARLFTKIPVTAVFGGLSDNKRRWKQILLLVQMISVSFVFTFMFITLLQFNTLRNGNFGYEHENLLYVRLSGNLQQYQTYRSELSALPQVESIGMSYQVPANGYGGQPCMDEVTGEMLFTCRLDLWDVDYLNTMKIKLVEGENFTPESKYNSVLVNEKYVQMRGWQDSPIGKTITDGSKQLYTIIGVVGDFRTDTEDGKVEPIVIHPSTIWTSQDNCNSGSFYTTIRLTEMTAENVAKVSETIKQFKNQENTDIHIFDNTILTRLSLIKNVKNMMILLTVITLLIALIGLYGYLNDEMNRRSREIAIRKVNGATVGEVLVMFGRNMLPLALVAVIIGLTGAFILSTKLLQTFESRIPLSWWIFALSALFIFATVYIMQIGKTCKLALSSPIVMLRKVSE